MTDFYSARFGREKVGQDTLSKGRQYRAGFGRWRAVPVQIKSTESGATGLGKCGVVAGQGFLGILILLQISSFPSDAERAIRINAVGSGNNVPDFDSWDGHVAN
jgi:hypothetical protein